MKLITKRAQLYQYGLLSLERSHLPHGRLTQGDLGNAPRKRTGPPSPKLRGLDLSQWVETMRA